MNANSLSKRRMGITLRTALLSWMVSIVTLTIFVIVIIPQQKQNFLENLESKAQSVIVLLGAEVASAAVNGDYSSIVPKCEEIVQGDESLHFLVIAKNDGFALLHQRSGWTMETNTAAQWRPRKLEQISEIREMAMANGRVFYYAQPFGYTGIQWGWIHMGLSLEGYNRSVATVYWRTGILAIVCIILSLLASLVYAKHLLKPILNLRTIVEKVAGGDLRARARIESNDELGSLAQSVNIMTETLLRRDEILQSVRYAAQQFLSTPNWRDVINGVLAKLGQASAVSRIRIFEKHNDAKNGIILDPRFVWQSPNLDSTASNDEQWSGLNLNSYGLEAWDERFRKNDIASVRVSELEPKIRALFEVSGAMSFLIFPIMVEGDWWGLLSLVECNYEREWTEAERDSIRAAVDMLGAAIVRQQIQDALIEAKENLELRVNERTRQLQVQVVAQERARKELADTQIQLMEISRRAGMAEIATGVLHNVGNVLNSVNVSATLIHDRIRNSKIASLTRLSELLQEQETNIGTFLTQDPRGQRVPSLIKNLADYFQKEQDALIRELDLLVKNVNHIKDIVSMQQSYAKVAGVLDLLPMSQIVDDALQLNDAALKRHGIEIYRDYKEVPPVFVDKHKVLQILINIIRNAKYAMDARVEPYVKRLDIHIGMKSDNMIAIYVKDNGIGIPPENLTRIFSHGFTTRKDGHGFGLHMGALAAKELGGSLTALSEGHNMGATFVLALPIQSK